VNSAIVVALRRLRAPIVLLVAIFAVGIVGLVLSSGRELVAAGLLPCVRL